MNTTTGIKLPVYVYNDFFINCLDNHLIGLLIMRDESFRRAVCAFRTNYSMIAPKRERTRELPANFHQQGYFLLQVDLQRIGLDEWFDRTEVDVRAYRDIHAAIRENLQQGFYMLVLLDRFYFPRGIEYQKQHRIHSSFIYGYDEVAGVYHLVEDCEQFGVMKHYDLSFRDLEIAFAAALEEDPTFIDSTYAFRLNEEREFTYALPRDVIIENVSYLLEETHEAEMTGFADADLLERHTGLSCISRFAEMVGDVYSGLGDEYIHQFIPAGRPLQVQRKNLLTLHYLEQEGFFQNEQELRSLEAGYQELFAKWELYRNRLFKYILMRDRYPAQAAKSIDFAELKQVLQEIDPLEKEMTRRFLDVLRR